MKAFNDYISIMTTKNKYWLIIFIGGLASLITMILTLYNDWVEIGRGLFSLVFGLFILSIPFTIIGISLYSMISRRKENEFFDSIENIVKNHIEETKELEKSYQELSLSYKENNNNYPDLVESYWIGGEILGRCKIAQKILDAISDYWNV